MVQLGSHHGMRLKSMNRVPIVHGRRLTGTVHFHITGLTLYKVDTGLSGLLQVPIQSVLERVLFIDDG